MLIVFLRQLAVAVGLTVTVAIGVLLNYFQYEAIKHDPIYAFTFLINVVVVITTAVWSYKSFGQAIRDTKKTLGAVLKKQQHTDLQVTNIYGYLRSFGSRLQKLDDIEMDVDVVEQEVQNK